MKCNEELRQDVILKVTRKTSDLKTKTESGGKQRGSIRIRKPDQETNVAVISVSQSVIAYVKKNFFNVFLIFYLIKTRFNVFFKVFFCK